MRCLRAAWVNRISTAPSVPRSACFVEQNMPIGVALLDAGETIKALSEYLVTPIRASLSGPTRT